MANLDSSEAPRLGRRITITREEVPAADRQGPGARGRDRRPLSGGTDLYDSFLKCCEVVARMLARPGS